MGMLINGVWFEDEDTNLKENIKLDDFSETCVDSESNRYHLYLSSACPFSHRVLLALFFKGLESSVGVTVVHWDKNRNGWEFKGEFEDDICGFKYLHQHYTRSNNAFTGRVSVPILWDKKLNKIINNQSFQIIEILNTRFESLAKNKQTLAASDFLSSLIINDINFSVYSVRASKTYDGYFSEVKRLFEALDYIDSLLHKNKYLLGDTLGVPDILLLPTLVRFHKVYFDIFKCDFKKISDYPNIKRYISCFDDLVNKTYDAVYTLQHYSTCFKPCSFSMLELLGQNIGSEMSSVVSPAASFLKASAESAQVLFTSLSFFTNPLEVNKTDQDEDQINVSVHSGGANKIPNPKTEVSVFKK